MLLKKMSNKKNILIINEDRYDQNVLCSVLQRFFGCNVIHKKYLFSTLYYIKRNKPEIIFVNISDLNEEGITVLNNISASIKNYNAEIVVLIPSLNNFIFEKLLSLKINNCIVKPLSRINLFNELEKIINYEKQIPRTIYRHPFWKQQKKRDCMTNQGRRNCDNNCDS
jgi:DNA-binding NarL/FixJ family response regulator